MSDSTSNDNGMSANSNGGFSLGVTGNAPSEPATAVGPSAPSGTDGTSGGVTSGNDTGGTTSTYGGGATATSVDDATGLTVQSFAAEPLATPAIHITIPNASHNVSSDVARSEAATIGTLTALALNKLGVPPGWATYVGSQVNVALSSTTGQTALQSANETAVNVLARAAEVSSGTPFGLSVGNDPATQYGVPGSYNGPGQ